MTLQDTLQHSRHVLNPTCSIKVLWGYIEVYRRIWEAFVQHLCREEDILYVLMMPNLGIETWKCYISDIQEWVGGFFLFLAITFPLSWISTYRRVGCGRSRWCFSSELLLGLCKSGVDSCYYLSGLSNYAVLTLLRIFWRCSLVSPLSGSNLHDLKLPFWLLLA